MTYYCITGRVHGDWEDTAICIEAFSVESAKQEFDSRLREARDVRAYDPNDEDTCVYINTVASSATPIILEI